MKIAIISDVHADVHALSEALVQIEGIGCDLTICAGDLVDYGLFPDETIALLRDRRIPTIRGNHDRWAIGRGSAHRPDNGDSDLVVDGSGWDLSRESLAFLAELPLTWRATIDGVRVAMVHASPGSDLDGIYPPDSSPHLVDQLLDEAAADVLLAGHTHVPLVAVGRNGGLLANSGALLCNPAVSVEPASERAWEDQLVDYVTLEPVVPSPRRIGTFGVLVLPERRFMLHRVSDGAEINLQPARW